MRSSRIGPFPFAICITMFLKLSFYEKIALHIPKQILQGKSQNRHLTMKFSQWSKSGGCLVGWPQSSLSLSLSCCPSASPNQCSGGRPIPELEKGVVKDIKRSFIISFICVDSIPGLEFYQNIWGVDYKYSIFNHNFIINFEHFIILTTLRPDLRMVLYSR